MMPKIYIFLIFQIMLVYGIIYVTSIQTILVNEQKIIPACIMGNMVECIIELKNRLNNDSIAYQQLEELGYSYMFPLTVASEGYTELIDVLLSSGVNVNQRFVLNNTMLHYAACYGHFDTVHFLLTRGANVSVREWFGETPLHKCSSNGNANITELLLQYGADINAKTRFGNTPLHLAVYRAHSAVIQCLLKHGCDKSIVNDWGSTAEEVAKTLKNVEIQKLFSSR